jgi:hypothetical protein
VKSGTELKILQTSDSYYSFSQGPCPKLFKNKFKTVLPTLQAKISNGFFSESEAGPD